MGKSILLANNEFVPLTMGIVIFILIWVVIFKTLKEIPLCKGRVVCAIMATCVSLLCIISMFRILGVRDGTHNFSEKISDDGHNLDIILFPYATLGITIVLISLLLLARKLIGKNKPKKILKRNQMQIGVGFSVRPG